MRPLGDSQGASVRYSARVVAPPSCGITELRIVSPIGGRVRSRAAGAIFCMKTSIEDRIQSAIPELNERDLVH